MATKSPKPEEIVVKLRQVEVLMGQGMSRLDAIRQIGVVEQTYYRWRRRFGTGLRWSSISRISPPMPTAARRKR